MAAPTNFCIVKINLANSEPSIHGTKQTYCRATPMPAFGGKADIGRHGIWNLIKANFARLSSYKMRLV